MAKISPSTRMLAQEVFVATIAAHYQHGLERGLKLNLTQIAGESVEAALTLEKKLQDEHDHGVVTAVMDANNAFSQGFVAGRAGHDIEELIGKRPELADNYRRGYAAGEEDRHTKNTNL